MLYILEVDLYRKKNNINDFIEDYEEFRDDDLIKARNKCFSKYQSYIDVLLLSKNKEYKTHEKAKKDLRDFLYTDIKHNPIGLPVVETGVGISIIFIYDDTIEVISKKRNITGYKEGITIHGLNNEIAQNYDELYLKNLKFEYEFYISNGLYIPQNLVDNTHRIIKTPINFKNFVKK